MGERAKLRYNGVSYYDRDLKIISDKACKELTCVFHSYKLDRKTGFLIVYACRVENNILINFHIPFKKLDIYIETDERNFPLVVGKKKYTDDMLMQIGEEVASLWGAFCLKYEIDKEKREVNFICNEHGEFFETSISFNKLSDYLY